MNTTTEVFHGVNGHFEHLSRHFLSKADYFLNNDRGVTPLHS